MKFFICIIIVMAYVFNLFHVVTVKCNAGTCFCFENVECCKRFWVCDCPCVIILVAFLNLYVVLILECVFKLIMSVTRKYFRSIFLSLSERKNMNLVVHIWLKNYVILNTVSLKVCCSSLIQFSQCDIFISASVVLYSLWYWI